MKKTKSGMYLKRSMVCDKINLSSFHFQIQEGRFDAYSKENDNGCEEDDDCRCKKDCDNCEENYCFRKESNHSGKETRNICKEDGRCCEEDNHSGKETCNGCKEDDYGRKEDNHCRKEDGDNGKEDDDNGKEDCNSRKENNNGEEAGNSGVRQYKHESYSCRKETDRSIPRRIRRTEKSIPEGAERRIC